nr:MAG TPA: hypothetical protein [Bacteriophage sp.]
MSKFFICEYFIFFVTHNLLPSCYTMVSEPLK